MEFHHVFPTCDLIQLLLYILRDLCHPIDFFCRGLVFLVVLAAVLILFLIHWSFNLFCLHLFYFLYINSLLNVRDCIRWHLTFSCWMGHEKVVKYIFRFKIIRFFKRGHREIINTRSQSRDVVIHGLTSCHTKKTREDNK